MPEMNNRFFSEDTITQARVPDTDVPFIKIEEVPDDDATVKIERRRQEDLKSLIEISSPVATPVEKEVGSKKSEAVKVNKRDAANAQQLQEQCRQLCLSLFFSEQHPVRSLGFTSSIGGEGKSFLALATARILAHDSYNPVTLVECNWEHPTLHKHFGIPATPGLAEWLQGSCNEEDIRYKVDDNVTVIPAGDGLQDAVKLLQAIRQQSLLKIFENSNELLILDLPPVISCGYGTLAASLVESIIIVARSQAVPESTLLKTCTRLADLPVHGIILNQENSSIPRWIRQIL